MDDISRELEREIAKSRPKPFRKKRKTKVLVVDDFGKIVSGDHMKFFVIVLSFISIITFVGTVVFYSLYTSLSRDAVSIRDRLVLAEKKINELTGEKEVLMARLVISGKDPGINKTETSEREEKKPLVSKSVEIKSDSSESIQTADEKTLPATAQKEKTADAPDISTNAQSTNESLEPVGSKPVNKTVSIEKFTVSRDGPKKDLLVRFDIRNISKDQKDVSGRIFTVLKSDNDSESQWLVVPATPLKQGIPSESRKGQYFSIAHFKPVKFRIKNEAGPDFYKRAAIFIFNNDGDLIFQEVIDISEGE